MSSPFRRLCHWGPIAVLGIIKLITWSMIHLMGMWWPPHESLGGFLHALLFLFMAASTLYYFLQAILEGPGFVPLGWKPENEADTEFLQYCSVCKGYKAPRSHHCRKCGYCVKKMDHHCPWINCCVGHTNHGYFTKFLIFAVVGCFHACIVLLVCLYHAIHRVWYLHHGTGKEPMVYLTLTTLLLSLLATGMAIGVVLAVGVLLYFQIRGIIRNRTTVEDWILEKATSRRREQALPQFVFPYDLGWKKNIEILLESSKYDGIRWPIVEGCGEYDLTMEQRAQKHEKQQRARCFVACRAYSGRWMPLAFPRAALAPPCSDEPRLPLRPGDTLRATRRRRQWLFGEKLTGVGDGKRGMRGWFPMDAAVPDPQIHFSTNTQTPTPNNKHKPE